MDAFIGEIRPFAISFFPEGWLPCSGQLVPIQRYPELNSIVGMRYGGDGKTVFGIPNLNAKVPIGAGTAPGLTPRPLGQISGHQTVTISPTSMPRHRHEFGGATGNATTRVATPGPTTYLGNFAADVGTTMTTMPGYTPQSANTLLKDSTLTISGGSAAHDNHSPYQVIAFYICASSNAGFYPLRP